MTRWKLTIDVKELWQKAANREIEVNNFKNKLYEILSTYTQSINSFSLNAVETFSDLLSNLNDNKFEDYDDFDNNWMHDFYNFCDNYRIWVKTF